MAPMIRSWETWQSTMDGWHVAQQPGRGCKPCASTETPVLAVTALREVTDMPAVSQAQYRLMRAAENSPAVRARTGITPKVAKEYTSGVNPSDLPARRSIMSNALRAHGSKK